MAMSDCELTDDGVLNAIQILKLVDEDRIPTRSQLRTDRGDAKKLRRFQHQRIEVGHVSTSHDVSILVVNLAVSPAQRLIDLAASRDRIIQVGHVERYNPAITAIAHLVHEVRYLEAERLGVFVARSLDVDVLLDLMIHDINLVLSLLKQEVVDIRAVGVPVLTDKVDITNVRLELANGGVANLTASRVSQDRVRKVRLFGMSNYISIDTREQEVKGFHLDGKNIEPLQITVEKKEPLRAELESFVECVRERKRPIVAGEDGRDAVALAIRVAAAIEESLRRFRV